MFDNIQCEMPLPEGAEKVGEWQTKCLDCGMIRYAIRADGSLVDTNSRMEELAGAPPAPEILSSEWFAWRKRWWEHRTGPDMPVTHTGSVNFYGTDTDGQWWEFVAFFKAGKCFEIVQLEPKSETLAE